MRQFQSENLDQIAPALSAAQAELEDVVAELEATIPLTKGGNFKYKYCDLASVRKVVRPVLAKYGLSFTQPVVPRDEPIMAERFCVLGSLRTMLLHSSGQWIAGEHPIAGDWTDGKAIGGAISYARRYGLLAICGIAQVDDVSEAAASVPRSRLAQRSNGAAPEGRQPTRGHPQNRYTPEPPPREGPPLEDLADEQDRGADPGTAPYYRQHPDAMEREDAAREFLRQEQAARFGPGSNPAPAVRRVPPKPTRGATPATGPQCPHPYWEKGKGGMWGWVNDNDLVPWFTALGSREDLKFPDRIVDWSEDQRSWACNEYRVVQQEAHASAQVPVNGRA